MAVPFKLLPSIVEVDFVLPLSHRGGHIQDHFEVIFGLLIRGRIIYSYLTSFPVLLMIVIIRMDG
jgi:hypothetical protein